MGDNKHIQKNSPPVRNTGFTIVELLIVIVVIAILATITIIAFNGIQNRAKSAAIKTELAAVGKQMHAWSIQNSDKFPSDITSAQSLGILKNSSSVTFDGSTTYIVNNATNPANYCVTGSGSDGKKWTVTSTSSPQAIEGECVTNIYATPTSGSLGCVSGATQVSNQAWGGRSDWRQILIPSTGGQCRSFFSLTDLVNGEPYKVSFSVVNQSSSPSNLAADFSDTSSATVPGAGLLQPNQLTRFSFTGQRTTYDSTFRFLDIASATRPNNYLINDIMVTRGSTLYSYGDGNTSGWFWNGTAGASTSTGPALAQ